MGEVSRNPGRDGKTKGNGRQLASVFRGQADECGAFSLPRQIYQGLDVITNKVTPEERQLVAHHLIDCASPLARWTVTDFQRRSLPIVSALYRDRGCCSAGRTSPAARAPAKTASTRDGPSPGADSARLLVSSGSHTPRPARSRRRATFRPEADSGRP